jgi:hypothetical protein
VAIIAMGMLALSLVPASSARADSILITLAGAPVANGPNWDWTYNVSLTGFSQLWSGLSLPGPDVWAPDFAEVYDFGGYVGGISFTAVAAGLVNADFTVSTPAIDTAAEAAVFGPLSGEVLADDAGTTNLKLEFNRALPYTNAGATDILLGTLTATSSNNFLTVGDYISTDTKSDGASGKHSASVQVPTVPTPQTVWGGMALFGLVGLVKARRLVGV